MTFRAFSIGFSTAVLALACGSDSGDETPNDVVPDRGPPTCIENPYVVDCTGERPENAPPPDDGEPPVGGPGPGPGPDVEPSARDLELAIVENILKEECGGCHGSQLTPDTARSGMNYIDDIDKLVEEGKLKPLDAENSIVIRRMRLGEMPPVSEGFDPVEESAINTVANFMNNPDFWDVEAPEICNEVVDFDRLYEEVADDLGDAEADDAVFFRYISLANRVTAGTCASGTALDRDRQALIKMMNALSIDSRIEAPVPVDNDKTLYRIDLRDYQWDRAIDVNGENFADVWEAIIDANEYAVPFVGDQADDARDDAQTDVPVMFLDSMLDVATVGNLYYAIVDIDVNQTIDDFILNELEIDVEANLDEETLIRAGTTRSRISRQDRLIEGHDIEVRDGVFYQSFDFEDVAGNDSIFEDPFGFNEGGREAIFNLPNGMLAYVIADANGNIVEDSDILLDTTQGNFRALASVSCSGCHAQGFIEVEDEVREVVRATARDLIANGTLDQEQLDQLENVYLPADEFKARIEDDSEIYLNALEQADLPTSGADQISQTFLRFDRDLELADAAGDLGVTADELQDELSNLDPSLQILERGVVDRDDFTEVYVASLCVMSAVLENQPDAVVCDDAIAALDL